MAKKTHARLKKELDAVFSKYIRWYYADTSGYVECYTCGQVKPVKEMQNGHFQSRKHLATRWHLNNCRPQCVACNMFRQGEQYLYGQKLAAEIGQQDVDEIIRLAHTTQKFSKGELQTMINEYKIKLQTICF